MSRQKPVAVLGRPSVKRVVEAQRVLIAELPNLTCGDDVTRRCWACGRTCRPTLAHIVARRYGGNIEPENFLLLCRTCHKEQPDELPMSEQLEWLRGVSSARQEQEETSRPRRNTDAFWLQVDMTNLRDQFERGLDRSDPSGCWTRPGATNSAGRPHMTVTAVTGRQVQELTSRVALRVSGRPQTGRFALHGCHNKVCVRVGPEDRHLHWGSQKQNWDEMRNARRNVSGLRRRPELAARGERHGSKTKPDAFRARRAAITREQAERARTLLAEGKTQREVADLLGLKQSVVSNIDRRTTRFRGEPRLPHVGLAEAFVRAHPEGVRTRDVAAHIGQGVDTARATLGRVAKTGTIAHVGRKWLPSVPK